MQLIESGVIRRKLGKLLGGSHRECLGILGKRWLSIAGVSLRVVAILRLLGVLGVFVVHGTGQPLPARERAAQIVTQHALVFRVQEARQRVALGQHDHTALAQVFRRTVRARQHAGFIADRHDLMHLAGYCWH